MKNRIVRAETPEDDDNAEEIVEAEAEVHSTNDDDNNGDDNDVSSKSVKFNEENTFVAEVGTEEKEAPEDTEEITAPASARAVSTPASESSPRPSAQEPDSLPGSRASSAKSVAGNTIGNNYIIPIHL